MKEKILHVFSIKMVDPYEATTQKVKNVAQIVFKGYSDAIFIISL